MNNFPDFSVSTREKENGLQLSNLVSIKYLKHFSNTFLYMVQKAVVLLFPLYTPIGHIEQNTAVNIMSYFG